MSVHRKFEETTRPATIGFGPVKRHVGVTQKKFGLLAVGGRDCNTDASPDIYLMPAEFERLLHRINNSFPRTTSIVCMAKVCKENNELISPKARDGTAASNAVEEAAGNRLQQSVTYWMT